MQGNPVQQMPHTTAQLEQHTGIPTELLGLLLPKLAAEGLAADLSSTVAARTGMTTPSWTITGFGRRVLTLLRDDPAVDDAPRHASQPQSA
jgi:hypothetical protein